MLAAIHPLMLPKIARWRQWAKGLKCPDGKALLSLLDSLFDLERQRQSEAVLNSLRANVYTLIGRLLWNGVKAPGVL